MPEAGPFLIDRERHAAFFTVDVARLRRAAVDALTGRQHKTAAQIALEKIATDDHRARPRSRTERLRTQTPGGSQRGGPTSSPACRRAYGSRASSIRTCCNGAGPASWALVSRRSVAQRSPRDDRAFPARSSLPAPAALP